MTTAKKMDLPAELAGAGTVGIAGHVRPDGDAVGACMGLFHYVKANFPDLEVTVYLEEVPEKYLLLKDADKVCTDFSQERQHDVFIALDCADEARLGAAGPYFAAASRKLCFDHHISNTGYADVNVILPDASSTSEVLCGFLEESRITKDAAEALYMGIVHDTGVFRHSCTAPETLETAAMLMRKGIDCARIINETFYDKTYLQNQILGRALMESIRLMDGRVIFSALRLREMKFYGVTPADLDGIVETLMGTKGVEAAIFLYEMEPHVFRVSMRSRQLINVSAIASFFGGGGHVRAAGCTIQGNLYDVVNNVTYHMERQFEKAGEGSLP